MKLIPATELQPRMVLALPFGKTATITSVKVGRTFVNFRTEYGPSRIEKGEHVMIEDDS